MKWMYLRTLVFNVQSDLSPVCLHKYEIGIYIRLIILIAFALLNGMEMLLRYCCLSCPFQAQQSLIQTLNIHFNLTHNKMLVLPRRIHIIHYMYLVVV